MESKLNNVCHAAAVLGLFLGLSLVFVLLRVYVKTFLSKSWGSDDILLVLSLVCSSQPGFYGATSAYSRISCTRAGLII